MSTSSKRQRKTTNRALSATAAVAQSQETYFKSPLLSERIKASFSNIHLIELKNQLSCSKTIRLFVGSTNDLKIEACLNSIMQLLQQLFQIPSTSIFTSISKDSAPDLVKVLSQSSENAEFRIHVLGINAESDIPEQPFGDTQTELGANNRLKKVMQHQTNHLLSDVCISIAMENGLFSEELSTSSFRLNPDQQKMFVDTDQSASIFAHKVIVARCFAIINWNNHNFTGYTL